jgi:uncharacterized protein (TIRG00374 family)
VYGILQEKIMKNKPSTKSKLALSTLLMFALVLLTFYIIFKDNAIEDIVAAVATCNPLWLLLGVVMVAGYVLFQAVALKVPMKTLGVHSHFREYLGVTFAGIYFSGVTPSSTGGQPMQLYYMRRRGIPVADGSLSLLLANIAFQLVSILYGLVMLAVRFRYVREAARDMTALIIFGYIVTGFLLFGLCFVMFSKRFARGAAAFMVRLLARLRIVKDAEKTLHNVEVQMDAYTEGAAVIRRHPALFTKVLLATTAQTTCQYLVPFFVYKAFGLSGASVIDLLAMQSILYISVFSLPLPGAVGASEKGFVSLFSTMFSPALIMPGMLVTRMLTFYLLMVVSGIVTACLHLQKPVKVVVAKKAPGPSRHVVRQAG